MREKYHGLKLGEVRKNNQGKEYQIVRLDGCKDVRVKFIEGGWEKTTTAYNAYSGTVRLPKWFVGDVVSDKYGNPVSIVEIVSSSRYLFEWEDGYQRWAQAGTIEAKTLMREEHSTRMNPQIKVGGLYTNLQGYTFEVIEKEGHRRVRVKFHTNIPYEVWCYGSNILKGAVHYPFGPTVAGVGILGLFEADIKSYQYTSWVGMLKRVYNSKTERAKINYSGCSVVENWHWLEEFHGWASGQKYKPGWQLDKDLLVKGNRVYGPETSIYVPREINTFLTDRANERGPYPAGVTIRSDTGRFQASCSNNGSPGYLGVYDTPEEAFSVYKKEKERLAKQLASYWEGIVDSKVIDALLRYTVDISD